MTPTAVSEGAGTSLALGSDGNVYAWGSGFTGDGSSAPSATPVRVSLPGGVTATAVSEGVGTGLALSSDGSVYAWGNDDTGELGNGSVVPSGVATPVLASLPAGVTATAVSEGSGTSLALGSDGSVYAWGNNRNGELGNGSTTDSSTPVRVSLPGGVAATAVSEGEDTSLAVGSDGNVYAWGNGQSGQLGDGPTFQSVTPVRVSLPGGVTATAVSEGYETSLALGSDGNVYAWGRNGNGELGNGSTTDSSTPVRVSLPGGVTATAVSEGYLTSLALGSDGNVYAWGNNFYGQLGVGSTTDSWTPVRVSFPAGVAATAVSAGGGTSLAIASGGPSAPVSTTTTLTASPNPAGVTATVTLTAAVAAADGTNPAGLVQFEIGGTDLGSPVAVTTGLATTTTYFAATGSESLSATFTPASVSYLPSTGSYIETVGPYGIQGGTVPVLIAVPQTGAFTVTLTPGTVNLSVSGLTATGTLQDVTVIDTRNYYPGWSVSGQESGFTGAGTAVGSTIAGDQLGWAPLVVGSLQGGATLGGTVAPVSPGLGSTAATLAVAAPGFGFGTNVLSASVTLAIPSAAAAGPYSGTMTLTFVEAGP